MLITQATLQYENEEIDKARSTLEQVVADFKAREAEPIPEVVLRSFGSSFRADRILGGAPEGAREYEIEGHRARVHLARVE